MSEFPPIGAHGIIGDLRTCALVSADGEIDWFCPGRFDRPSVFASLLDRERGGKFRVSVDGAGPAEQRYVPGTAVLTTRFTTSEGVGEVCDFMPVEVHPKGSRIVRILRGVEGLTQFSVEFRPRSDYGRRSRLAIPDVILHCTHDHVLGRRDNDLYGTIALAAGQTAVLVATNWKLATDNYDDWADLALESTTDYWRHWIGTSTYRGHWPQEVHRSAITLKLLTHEPTGAPVAAATAGLPEEIGGERNWDYRYTWIRDGAFTAKALLDLGFRAEGEAFAGWASERLRGGPGPDGELLQIMYRVDGGSDLAEESLPELSGYENSAPVRIGNGASDQLQLDIYGELLFGLADGGLPVEDVATVLDWLLDHWDRPDEGIWETRGGRRDFTYSRLMCWTAFDRGLAVAPSHSKAPRWLEAREAIAQQIRAKAWDEKQGAYVQSYGDTALDASLLFMPYVGFIVPDDERWKSTMDAIDRSLVKGGLCHRYHTSDFSDGLQGEESSFDLCSLLFHIALAQSGDVERARREFAEFLSHAGPTGLFAEELTSDGVQLGNIPQAFTHLGVIWAALALDAALGA